MQKEYNVISKKEFIIYSILPVVSTIQVSSTFLTSSFNENISFLCIVYFAIIIGVLINIIFNFWKINNNKAKLIIKILFNIFAVLYTICLFILILGVNLLFSE